MTDEPEKTPKGTPAPGGKAKAEADERQRRLAEQLRANLKRRKRQERSRAAEDDGGKQD